MFENHEHRKHPFMLKFDCRKMRKYEIAKFMEELLPYGGVQGIGGVIVYIKGNVTNIQYEKIWAISDKYDVIID